MVNTCALSSIITYLFARFPRDVPRRISIIPNDY